MSEIWIVQGTTGEYSDRTDWPVMAFRSEVKAQRLVVEAQARASEIESKRVSPYSLRDDEKNEFDPNMQMDYTGTQYTCYPIQLDEAI